MTAAQIALGEKDDHVAACVRYLSALPDIRVVLGAFSDDTPWIFQYELHTVVEGSQSAALVISHAGSWGAPSDHNTVKVPRLSLELWTDPLRDSMNNTVEVAETFRRANAIYDAINWRMHRPQKGVQMWGNVRTLSCIRLGEPSHYPVPDGDKALRSQVFYGLEVG